VIRGVRSTIELTDAPDGSARVALHWRGDPKGLPGRLMAPMLRRQIEGAWTRSLEALDTLALTSRP
jgi:hypothetical protein